MASYVDNPNKLDWAMSFQRTGTFPLDRSSMFASKADAEKYAAGDTGDPDSRGLCGSSYIGQVITVYENDIVMCYVINASRGLQPVGSATAGDEKSIHLEANEDGSGVLSLFGFSAATAGQQPRVKSGEDGTLSLEWFTPDTSTVSGLQSAVDALNSAVGIGDYTGTGLTKDVADLKAAVGTPKVPDSGSGETPATGIYAEIEKKAGKATTLAGYGITDAYTKAEVDGIVGSVYYYKGSYDNLAALRAAESSIDGLTVGWTYNLAQPGGWDSKGTPIKAGDNVALSAKTESFTPVQYVLTTTIAASGYATIEKTAITDGSAIRVGDKVQDATATTPNYGTVLAMDDTRIYVACEGTTAPVLDATTLYSWDVLAGTTDLSNFYNKSEIDQKLEEAGGNTSDVADRVTALETTVGKEAVEGDSPSPATGLIKDIRDAEAAIDALETAVGTPSVPAGEDPVSEPGSPATGLFEDVEANTGAIETLNGDEQTEGSVKKLVADSAATLQEAIDAITEVTTGTIDTRIATHNTAPDAHSAQFAAKQNKVIRQDVTIQPSQFVASTTYPDVNVEDEYVQAVEVSTITGVDALKDYVASVAVVRGSEDEVLSAGFSPSVVFYNGKLYLFSRNVPTGNITLSVTLTEIQA